MSVMIFAVAGVTFAPGYPQNLTRLHAAMDETSSHRKGTALEGADEGPSVVLIRNPENVHDSNAIEVHVPAIATGDDPKAGMIGHVPKAVAARWAPLMDKGEMPVAWVDGVRVKKGHEDRPGIDVKTVWPPKGGESLHSESAPGNHQNVEWAPETPSRDDDREPGEWAPSPEERADHVRRARYEPDDGVTLADAQAAGFPTVNAARAAFEGWQADAQERGSW